MDQFGSLYGNGYTGSNYGSGSYGPNAGSYRGNGYGVTSSLYSSYAGSMSSSIAYGGNYGGASYRNYGGKIYGVYGMGQAVDSYSSMNTGYDNNSICLRIYCTYMATMQSTKFASAYTISQYTYSVQVIFPFLSRKSFTPYSSNVARKIPPTFSVIVFFSVLSSILERILTWYCTSKTTHSCYTRSEEKMEGTRLGKK